MGILMQWVVTVLDTASVLFVEVDVAQSVAVVVVFDLVLKDVAVFDIVVAEIVGKFVVGVLNMHEAVDFGLLVDVDHGVSIDVDFGAAVHMPVAELAVV
jgi:hypothetical protein